MRLGFAAKRRRRSREMSDPKSWKIGVVGYGEVGRILSEDLRKAGIAVAAYDIKLDDDRAPPPGEHAAKSGVALAQSHADLPGQPDPIISAVTASQDVPVAEAGAPAIREGTWYPDFTPASPGVNQRPAALIDSAHGRYVEG